MPRFGSITSTASYRPSYSGGTYRSSGIKRETPTVSTYTSRYSTLPTKETVREVSPAIKKTIASNSSKYGASTNDSNMKSTRFASTGNLSSAKSKQAEAASIRVGRPAITVSRIQSRNPSPLSTKSYSQSRSRDPSPSEPPKDRFISSSGYSTPTSYNKLYSKSPSYANKLSMRGTSARGMTSSPAVSYMTADDTSVRIMKRRTEKEERSSKSSAEPSPAKESQSNERTKVESSTPNEKIEMIEVTVVTRGTSPTLCSTTNYMRSRRIEVAKTIEKTIMRPRKMAKCEDKEVQSDRLDDTSKYCRFNSARAPTPWSPYLESKLSYSRFSNGNRVSPSKTPSRESPENSEKCSSKSRESSVTSKSSSASSRSSVTKTASSTTKSSKSKSKTPPIASLTKQKSPSTKSLPPPAPKSESPSKTSTSSTTANGNSAKWANKDFRKSALNVGPTDRPRKMRHSSVDTDSEENRSDDAQRKSMSPLHQQRSERSPSVSSEMSYSSGNNNNNNHSTANEIAKVFAKLKLSGVAVAANATNNEKTKANQTITAPHPNESCAKNETKSPSSMTKIFTNASSFIVGIEQPSQSNDDNGTDDDVLSICENIERIAIESALDQTKPTTKTTQINRKNTNNFNQIVDETTNNWLLNSIEDQTTTSTSDGNSTCQLINCLNENNALNMKNKLRHIDSGELPWWMSADDDNDTIADDITLNPSESETQASAELNDGNDTANWPLPSDTNQPSKPMYRITKICSGERAWWMDSDEVDKNGTDTINNREESIEPDTSAKFTFKIKRIESGEKAWWLTNDDPETENTENVDFWSEINEKNEQERNSFQKREQERDFYCDGPLGDRASPEGLEDFTSNQRILSPYACAGGTVGESFDKNAMKKLFISRHQNIDDILGGTSHSMNSMLMDQFDNGAPLEEILPTQVRIHDGTAQMSYMQYIGDER